MREAAQEANGTNAAAANADVSKPKTKTPHTKTLPLAAVGA